METAIKKIFLKRFRSFPQETILLDNPTFFVGQNGAGKSNLADAFSLLAESVTLSLQAVFDKRGGLAAIRNKTAGKSYPPNLGIGVEFGAFNGTVLSGRFAFEVRVLKNYGFEVVREQCRVCRRDGKCFWYDRHSKSFKTNIQGLKPSLDPQSLCLPVIGGDERFSPLLKALAGMKVYSIQPNRLREMQDPDGGMALRTDGRNATSILQELERKDPEALREVFELLEAIVPRTKNVRTKKQGNKLSLEFTQKWSSSYSLKFDASNMSDGTLRALGLLMAIYQRPSPVLLVLEEPEATIHPGAMGAILDLLHHATRRSQVVVTTHSPEILDAEWLTDNHLRIVSWVEGASHIQGASAATRTALQEHLCRAGELLRSNALTPQKRSDANVSASREPLFEVLK